MSGWNLTRFYIHFDLDKIKVGIVLRQYAHFYKRVMALDMCQNFIFAQYLKTECRELDKILHTDRYRQALG